MTTNRTTLKRPTRKPIAPEAITAFRLCLEIIIAGLDEAWEPKGRRRELLDASLELERQLRRRPWMWNILNAADSEPPAWC